MFVRSSPRLRSTRLSRAGTETLAAYGTWLAELHGVVTIGHAVTEPVVATVAPEAISEDVSTRCGTISAPSNSYSGR
jgi:hypothetical protein